jgi:hypothetical protein
MRSRKWVPRNAVAAPSTISQVHADVSGKAVYWILVLNIPVTP